MKKNSDLEKIMEHLELIDTKLRSHIAFPLSLNPQKKTISTFHSLGERYLDKSLNLKNHFKIALKLEQIVVSQTKNFPDNIFWDFDYLFHFLFLSTVKLEQKIKTAQLLIELQKGYGIHSPLHFQFMHDFTFGFDWARWVSKDSVNRKNTSLYDLNFLSYLKKRQNEIIKLIDKNDQKYHSIQKNEVRNPYLFDRSPENEKGILEQLAAQNLIPISAWETNPRFIWEKDFTQIREDLSTQNSA